MTALFGFQRHGAAWLAGRDRALLADQMGLGKTVQALDALDRLPDCPGAVIVTPAALRDTWALEAARWAPRYIRTVYRTVGSFRPPARRHISLVSYEGLPGQPLPPDTVVIADEAQALKSARSQRSRRFRAATRRVRWIWLLTGTPLMNRPPELWNLLRAGGLERLAYPGGWPEFCRTYGATRRPQRIRGGRTIQVLEWGRPLEDRADQAFQAVALRRTRDQVLADLPAKLWGEMPCAVTPEAAREADRLLRGLEAEGLDLMDPGATAADLVRAERLAFGQISRTRALLAACKIGPALEVAATAEPDEPLVLFSAHRAPVLAAGSLPGWGAVLGGQDSRVTTELIRRFQAGELAGLALTIQAGGTGVTLTRANRALFVDLVWTPAGNEQAEDRLCRIGQTRGVVITRMIADHRLDRRLLELLALKRRYIGTLKASREPGRHGWSVPGPESPGPLEALDNLEEPR